MYLAQHYGGYGALREIITQPEDGVDGINGYLSKHGYAARFEDVYRDWVVANYLDDPSVERYYYQDMDVKAKVEREVMGQLHDLAKFEMPKKVTLIARDFTIESGELTPSLKVKRRAVEKNYKELIDRVYAEADPTAAAMEG